MPGTQPVSLNSSLASFRRAISSLVIIALLMIISAALATMGHVTVTQRRVEGVLGFFTCGFHLRMTGVRPRRSRAAEQRDEFAARHSITSSARASKIGGRSKPKALAVFRLTTNSNLVPCRTGRSAGFAPLRILSTKLAERYHMSLMLAA